MFSGDVTRYSKPAELDLAHGAMPISYRVFLRIRLPLMRHREP